MAVLVAICCKFRIISCPVRGACCIGAGCGLGASGGVGVTGGLGAGCDAGGVAGGLETDGVAGGLWAGGGVGAGCGLGAKRDAMAAPIPAKAPRRDSPDGSIHMTGLWIVYIYKLEACKIAAVLSCMFVIFQNGSGCVNLPVLGLKLLARKYPLQVSKLQYWSTKYQSVI